MKKAIYKTKEWEDFNGETIKFKDDKKRYKVNEPVKKFWTGKAVKGAVKVGFDNHIVVYIKAEDPAEIYHPNEDEENPFAKKKKKYTSSNYWQERFEFDKQRNKQIAEHEELKHKHITKEACLNSAIALLSGVDYQTDIADAQDTVIAIAEKFERYVKGE